MKRTFCKVISVLMLLVMLIPTGIAAISSSAAASEKDYKATFSIKTDKTSVKKGETVKVSVNLKTNYYIFSMQVPVIYDGNAFEMQNTGSSLKSFLTFEGKMASSYETNGNWKSPDDFYKNRNSNPSYWSQKSVKDRYKVAFATWAANSKYNSGKLIKLANEETIVSFTLKANKDISKIDGLIFLHKDFMKTETFAGGLWFCGRSKTEKLDINNLVAAGQTLEFKGTAPSTSNPGGTTEDKKEAIVINYNATKNMKELVDSSAQNKNLKWTSADESIVTVGEDGNIYGAKTGETTVTVKSTDGKYTKTFNIQVTYAWWQWIIIIVLFGWIWYI